MAIEDDVAGDAPLSEELRELEAYREKVLEHLKEREQKMQEIEREISKVTFMLKEYGVQKLARTGDARAIMRGENFRGGLNRERARLVRKLEEARGDVALARDRLIMADAELLEARQSSGDES